MLLPMKSADPDTCWTSRELRLLRSLRTPCGIQSFIEDLDYSFDNFTRSPRESLQAGRAHCFDGALIAAAAFEVMGIPPLLVDLQADADTDHVLAIFKKNGRFGAVAKSNFSGLRYREPVYMSIRELVMSYFEGYFNMRRQRTLRAYSGPFNLNCVNHLRWRTSPKPLDEIGNIMNEKKHHRILPEGREKSLTPVDMRLFEAGKVGMRFKV